ncbi:MAG: class I SAM-dependent methyltransferase [Bacteroidota bacterium]|nr:class I SAM-dependent methyltransferase [Bacteroidota bacterium]
MNISEEEIKQHIKEQIAFNKGKNIVAQTENHELQFIEGTKDLIDKIRSLDSLSEQLLIDYLTDESLQEFCRVNQFFSFSSASVTELKAIYSDLSHKIGMLDRLAGQAELDVISQEHYRNLCDWLVRTNRFAEIMYSSDQKYIRPVACSEYTSGLQLEVLHIELKQLHEPVLDVGCGREMNLVNYLRDNGVEAYGIDRFDNESPYYIKTDWLEYDFVPGKWGSIISNLGFSNHFIHHNLRADGNYREYAQKYMEILHSLQSGGTFYYAPDLSFIEKHLDRTTYQYVSFPIEESGYKSIRITKI